jgi:hypothetical protein
MSPTENVAMNLEDAERWKKLERRARDRGWTIDRLDAGRFALMELCGQERALTMGNLDAIEAFLRAGPEPVSIPAI